MHLTEVHSVLRILIVLSWIVHVWIEVVLILVLRLAKVVIVIVVSIVGTGIIATTELIG